MKYLFVVALFISANASFANECKSMCKQNDRLCKEMVKKVEKMTKSMIKQVAYEKSDRKDMNRQLKSQVKELKFNCKEEKSLCLDMCR